MGLKPVGEEGTYHHRERTLYKTIKLIIRWRRMADAIPCNRNYHHTFLILRQRFFNLLRSTYSKTLPPPIIIIMKSEGFPPPLIIHSPINIESPIYCQIQKYLVRFDIGMVRKKNKTRAIKNKNIKKIKYNIK